MVRDGSYSNKVKRAIEKIAADNHHGASYLSVRALECLARAAGDYSGPADVRGFRDYLAGLAQDLATAQPAMCAIRNLLTRCLDNFSARITGEKTAAELTAKIRQICKAEKNQLTSDIDTLGGIGAAFLAERFPERARLVTLSASESVFAVLKHLSAQDVTVTVAESRPLREGLKLATRLVGLGFEVTLVTDAMLGVETAGADCALIGADSVSREGVVVSKAGTRLLALAAKLDKVPLFCCTHTLKIQPSRAPDPEPPIPPQNPRPPEEILKRPVKGIQVRNLYFDRTEYYLLTGFLTEKGYLRHREITRLSDQHASACRRVFGAEIERSARQTAEKKFEL